MHPKTVFRKANRGARRADGRNRDSAREWLKNDFLGLAVEIGISLVENWPIRVNECNGRIFAADRIGS